VPLIAVKYSPYLRNFYERVKARRGAGKPSLLWLGSFSALFIEGSKNKWVFEDFPNFVLAEPAEAA
jgi:transposase